MCKRMMVLMCAMVCICGYSMGEVVSISAVTAASENGAGVAASNTINGSGMTGDYHDVHYANMWISTSGGGGAANPYPGTEPGTTWIKYDFSETQALTSLWIWNYNGDPAGDVTNRGLKNVSIQYTQNGITWNKLGDYVINKATNDPSYAHNTTVYFNGTIAKSVIITAQGPSGVANWGSANYYGLSEIRFYGTPYSTPYANCPIPADGGTGVEVVNPVFGWDSGDYATEHEVYFGTDYSLVTQADHNSDEFMGSQSENIYIHPSELDYGQIYYWRIDETDGSTVWKGDVWSFTTKYEITMSLNRGITFDRRFHSVPPAANMTIEPIDIQLIKLMGFEFVKLLVTPSTVKSEATIDPVNMAYLDEIVNKVLNEGLPVVVCIHPQIEFKEEYLGNWDRFLELLGFYGDFAAYLAARWGPNELAFQLMTEPSRNNWDWNLMQPMLWSAVRGEMPDHTLILSGDQSGQVYGFVEMEPVDDDNVYYSFTFYEPWIIGWQGAHWRPTYHPYIGGVPYPANPAIMASVIPDVLANVPDQWDASAQSELVLKQAYSVYFSTGVATDFFGTAITRQPWAA